MKCDPQKHRRRSIRLKGYDYSRSGMYFVTIVAQDRECLFGNIVDGKILLNEAGQMVEKWYVELENKFPDIHCDAYAIMPNHFHAIIQNVGAGIGKGVGTGVGADVGADLRVCHANELELVGADRCVCPIKESGEHKGSPLQKIVQWFKTMTTNEYIRGVKQRGWKPFHGKLWQRNYWEHIIRDDEELNRIREYIGNNPIQWELDNENPDNSKFDRIRKEADSLILSMSRG